MAAHSQGEVRLKPGSMIKLQLSRCSVCVQSCFELGFLRPVCRSGGNRLNKSSCLWPGRQSAILIQWAFYRSAQNTRWVHICSKLLPGSRLIFVRFSNIRASLSCFSISLLLPKCISSGVCPLNAESHASAFSITIRPCCSRIRCRLGLRCAGSSR